MSDTSTPPNRASHARPGKAVGRRGRGVAASTSPRKPRPARSASFGARLRYRFDNALSRSIWVVIGYLGLATLLIVVLAGFVLALLRLGGIGGDAERLGPLEAVWQMLLRLFDAGTFSGDATWPTRLLGLLVTLAGIFIAGSLIGLIASAVDQQIDSLRRGRSNVIETGHTLILNWSARVPTIVGELVVANESEKHAAVVVLADKEKIEVEDTLRASVGDLKSTKLVARRGDPSRLADLDLVAARDARSIIIMSNGGDAEAIKASLAVLGLDLDPSIPVIAEMQSAPQAETLEAVTNSSIITVNSDRIIAEITAQACHERGLAQVFRELLDFDGDEMYFRAFPELEGATYAEAQQAFDRAAVMGLLGEDGVVLNPDPSTTIGSTDQLLALVEDDAGFVDPVRRGVPQVEPGNEPDPEPPQRFLLVGWSGLAGRVIRELDDFLSEGSELVAVIDPNLVDPERVAVPSGLRNTTVEVRSVTGGPELLGDLLGEEGFNQGILLGYRTGLSASDADARTLLTLMALRKRWPKGNPASVRLVAEVLDQRNVHIVQMAGVDDFIVSDQLASLMLAQLSERAALKEVFDELFDSEGASIVLRPAGRFAPDGARTFGELVAAGNHFAESVLGYRRASDGVVVLNPGRDAVVELTHDDEVVVVATRD